ncbi:MAG: helix-turn-helix domain-containing protein [Planctomycetota bacterium]
MPPRLSPDLQRKLIAVAVAAENDASSSLDVAALAELAGMSEKHFARSFAAVLGESPKRYLRRIRLQGAAYLLRWSDTSVRQIGLDAGFESPAGFTKAFTRMYGRSPLAFRDDRDVVPYLRRKSGHGLACAVADGDAYEATRLSVRIERVPERRIAYLRYVGPVSGMARAWTPMRAWLRRYELLHDDAELLGIYHDYWDDGAEDRYRYDTAVVLPAAHAMPAALRAALETSAGSPTDQRSAPVNTRVLPATSVAMAEFEGTLAEADRAWRRLVDQWLPASGYRPRAAFAYDRYPPALLQRPRWSAVKATLRGLRMTLCLPVQGAGSNLR